MATKPSPTGIIQNDLPLEPFMAWMREEGFAVRKCKVEMFPDTGRGVAAAKAIKKGEVLIEVPESSIITSATCSCKQELKQAGLDEDSEPGPRLEVEALILAVMVELIRGEKSRWYHYLEALPRELDTPVTWEDSELSCLVGTAAYDRFTRDRDGTTDPPSMVFEGWQRIANQFAEEFPKLGLPTGEDGLALYEYCTSLVSAYSFTLGDGHQAMVPFWDFLNHKTGKANIRLHHSEGKGTLQMIATRDIAQGEEVINSYGDLPNAELLRRHGFVEEGNPHEVAEVHAFAVRAVCWSKIGFRPRAGEPVWKSGAKGLKLWKRKLRLLESAGVMGRDHRFQVEASGAPPPELSAAVQLLLLPDTKFASFCKRLRRGQLPDLPPPSPFPTKSTRAVSGVFRDVAESQLGQYPASKDLREMDPAPLPGRLRAAEVVREAEMQCLHGMRGWGEANTKALSLHPFLVWSDRMSVGKKLNFGGRPKSKGKKKRKGGGLSGGRLQYLCGEACQHEHT